VGDPVVLHTGRLTLQAPTVSDVDAIHRACQDPDVQRWTSVPSPYTREDAEVFVELSAGWWQSGSEHVWAVHNAAGLVGMVGLHRIAQGAAELGYWMSAETRRRGYAAEAARTVVDFAFGPMRLERLEWHAVVGNRPSARLAQALGFRYEGLRRLGIRDGGRSEDGWIAGLLAGDDRAPVEWPVLDA
jgi:RimJ/RimL family protein N-acetyltransferase